MSHTAVAILILSGLHVAMATCLAVLLVRLPVVIGCCASLAGLGLAAALSFATFFVSIEIGRALSVIALLSVGACAGALLRRGEWRCWRAANRLLLPVTAYTAFVLVLGLDWASSGSNPLSAASSRWVPLPPDNQLPWLLAQRLLHGGRGPLLDDWLSSDRPPLQAGAYLLITAGEGSVWDYQVVCSWLQALVLLPMLLVLRAVAPRLAPAGLAVVGLSGVVAINALFVWPKLLAAAYVLCVFLLSCTSSARDAPAKTRTLLLGTSMSLAMLSHGTAAFGLIAVGLAFLASRPREALQIGAPALVFALVLQMPWMLYQRLVDPPGDRLLKWHLAGVTATDHRPFRTALRETYAVLPFDAWLSGRWANLDRLFGGSALFVQDVLMTLAGEHGQWALRETSAVALSYSLWFLAPAFVLLAWLGARPWARPVSPSAWKLAAAGAGSAVIAAFLLVQPGQAVLDHIGGFAWLTLIAFAVGLLSALPHALAVSLLLLQGTLFSAVYMPGTPAGPLAAGCSASLYLIACALSRGLDDDPPLGQVGHSPAANAVPTSGAPT